MRNFGKKGPEKIVEEAMPELSLKDKIMNAIDKTLSIRARGEKLEIDGKEYLAEELEKLLK